MQPDDARLQDVRAWLSKAILDLKAAGCGVAGFPISVVRYPWPTVGNGKPYSARDFVL
jgi:hypothetical protein